MHAVTVHGPNDVGLDVIAPPTLGDYDATVRVEACGVCGTYLSFIWMGGLPWGSSPMPLAMKRAGASSQLARKSKMCSWAIT